LLLITIGSVKYATEEKEIKEVSLKEGLQIRTVHVSGDKNILSDGEQMSMDSLLTEKDYIFAHMKWLANVFRYIYKLFSKDKKCRSLFVNVIPSIRQFYIYHVFARRIINNFGHPILFFSLCPSSQMSIVFADHMKSCNVLTAGIRTQTTSYALEHMAINTDILFCKSFHEKNSYKALMGDTGPQLKRGCLLSLPIEMHLNSMALQDKYILLLGTTPPARQKPEIHFLYNEKLLKVAKSAGLPIVFKGHTMATSLDQAWLTHNGNNGDSFINVTEKARNKELIDNATIIVTAASTLIYHGILANKPVIILESKYDSEYIDEFSESPIHRIKWEQEITKNQLNWKKLEEATIKTKVWFEDNYFLNKDSRYMLTSMLQLAKNSKKGK